MHGREEHRLGGDRVLTPAARAELESRLELEIEFYQFLRARLTGQYKEVLLRRGPGEGGH